MILNPTHEITLSGLPSDVLDAYVRYKKGSRAIVTWLVAFGPASYKGARTLPIKELGALAQKVAGKITVLPAVIDFHFRETIAARKCLSKYFRENRDVTVDDFDTVNHEHFTDSLNEIYRELCERCQSSRAHLRGRQSRKSQSDIAANIRNHYDCLPVEHIPEVEATLTALALDCEDCKDDIEINCTATKDEVHLEDDDVGVAIENVYLLDRAQSVFNMVENYWTAAGASQSSVVAAAGATNAAWQILLDIEAQLKISNPDISLAGLHRRTCILQDESNLTSHRNGSSKQHMLLLALEDSERSLKHYTEGHKLKTIESCASCVQKPADYIQPPGNSQASNAKSFQIALLDNIFHLINRAGSYPSLVLTGSPCLTEVGCLLSHMHDPSCTFKCILNLHLLAVSYRAFLNASPKPSAASMCRISALKVAQQAASTVQTVLADKHAFPCQCPQTLAYHLSNLEHNLTSYAKHKCWDLYFQSPWVAGTHIIEMLDMLSYYGMRLFHYRHYVGSILHTYNIAQQLGGLDPIEPLEQLCDLFKDLFFPAGGRPSTCFKNSWSRFVGARLKFKRGHKGQNHRENWCMAIPPHAARTAAGFSSDGNQANSDKIDPKFDYGRYDPLVKIKQQNYRPSGDAWEAMLDKQRSPTSSRPTSSRSSTTRSSMSSYSTTRSSMSSISSSSNNVPGSSSRRSSFSPLAHVREKSCHDLMDIIDTLDSSMTRPDTSDHPAQFPITRLNLLAIFATCTKMVGKISDQIHTSPEEKDNKNCICYTSTLLAGADRITEGRRLGRLEAWKKNERDIIEIVKNVITEVMTDLQKDDKAWIWDI